jgi:predicted RNA-binding Zn-ribbon protein involved in translation (DUF1610 family)
MTDAADQPVLPQDAAAVRQAEFPCVQCGAKLVFAPGTSTLKCPYCGADNVIAASAEPVEELDYRDALNQVAQSADLEDRVTIRCPSCAAEATLDPHVSADHCPFCGSPIVTEGAARRVIKPKALLPFHITREQADSRFRRWIAGLWFAPDELKQRARKELALTGMYVPYWTYDSDTVSDYTGMRGEYYWVTQTYTTVVNGRTVTRTRQVRHTRWYPAAGTVSNRFDDILILASRSLPRKYTEELEPWDLENLVPYADAYLSGFRAETYQVELDEGFQAAAAIMNEHIRQSIRRHIGGDEQRILSVRTQYRRITFKHVLLPVWLSAYRYRERVFRFLVNGRTGEVQGERPWSVLKITLAVLAALAAIAAIAAIASQA